MNESDIDQLLRQEAPEITPRPGLELRIRTALRQAPRNGSVITWFAIPATAVIAVLVVLVPWKKKPEPAEIVVSIPQASIEESTELDLNPLGNEAKALRKDAERTGRFLIDCLPSLSVSER